MSGGVLLAVGGVAYGAVKLSQKDADRIEEHTGASVEELSEEELVAAMEDLGIQSIELTEDDQAIIQQETGQAPAAQQSAGPAPAAAPAAPQASYLDQLERLGALRDQGVITEEEFQAQKQKILGL